MVKKIGSLCLSLILVLSLVGCGNKEVITPTPTIPQPTPEVEVSVPEVSQTPEIVKPIESDKSEVEPEINIEDIDFGEGSYDLRLFSSLLKNEENIQNNLCVSPFSLKQALLMVVQGAEEGSNSYLELSKFLDCDGDINSINKDIKHNNIILSSSDSVKFKISNLVLLDDGLAKSKNIENNFIKPLEDNYFAKVVDKDLQDSVIVSDINNFINESTNGTIPKMISNPFGDDVKSVLLNAIYFLGDWESPFPVDYTTVQEFNGINGITEVDMMFDEKNIEYKETDNYKSIILPYISDKKVINSPQFEMVLFVSKDNDKNIYDIFDELSIEEQESFFNIDKEEYSYEDTNILLPKFEIENTINLINPVKEMGLKYSISEGNFDFTNIKDYEKDPIGFKISDIVQKTYIKVDETGTEASAVTMIIMETDSISLDEELPKEFYADKPFMYVIRDDYTNTVLFAGIISNL